MLHVDSFHKHPPCERQGSAVDITAVDMSQLNHPPSELLPRYSGLRIWLSWRRFNPSPVQWVKGSGMATTALEVTPADRIQSLAQELPCAVGQPCNKDKKNHPPSLGLRLYFYKIGIVSRWFWGRHSPPTSMVQHLWTQPTLRWEKILGNKNSRKF